MSDVQSREQATPETELTRVRARALPTGVRATRAVAVGAAAVGALALGSLAIGAIAIGRLAVGALAMRRARVHTLIVDNLRGTAAAGGRTDNQQRAAVIERFKEVVR